MGEGAVMAVGRGAGTRLSSAGETGQVETACAAAMAALWIWSTWLVGGSDACEKKVCVAFFDVGCAWIRKDCLWCAVCD
jgi:hypothetical protein